MWTYVYISRILKLKSSTLYCSFLAFSTALNKRTAPPWRVLFFGNDKFSLISLMALYEVLQRKSVIDHLEVVSSSHKRTNPVTQYAKQNKLLIHEWPLTETVKNFDVGLVVSFGYLIPESIINSFPYGMINIHGSLLPRWRGAAPIIYALAKGDCVTGITVMTIEPNAFDIGKIVYKASISITEKMTHPELYLQLSKLGAKYLIKTLQEMPSNLTKSIPQSKIGITYAPKIGKNFECIHWDNMSSLDVYNLSRALKGIRTLKTMWQNIIVHISGIQALANPIVPQNDPNFATGRIVYDKRTKVLRVLCANGYYISVERVHFSGKKVIRGVDFYNGYVNKINNLSLRRFQ